MQKQEFHGSFCINPMGMKCSTLNSASALSDISNSDTTNHFTGGVNIKRLLDLELNDN